MWFILFGLKTRYSRKGETDAYCPICGTQRRMRLLRGKRWFTLFFIPVFPYKDLGPVQECTVCGNRYGA